MSVVGSVCARFALSDFSVSCLADEWEEECGIETIGFGSTGANSMLSSPVGNTIAAGAVSVEGTEVEVDFPDRTGRRNCFAGAGLGRIISESRGSNGSLFPLDVLTRGRSFNLSAPSSPSPPSSRMVARPEGAVINLALFPVVGPPKCFIQDAATNAEDPFSSPS